MPPGPAAFEGHATARPQPRAWSPGATPEGAGYGHPPLDGRRPRQSTRMVPGSPSNAASSSMQPSKVDPLRVSKATVGAALPIYPDQAGRAWHPPWHPAGIAAIGGALSRATMARQLMGSDLRFCCEWGGWRAGSELLGGWHCHEANERRAMAIVACRSSELSSPSTHLSAVSERRLRR